jgi:hypothetical protein
MTQTMVGPVQTIDWHVDVAAIPDDRRDGREVLLWFAAGYSVIVTWDDGWRDPVGRVVVGATHWADLGGPGV